SLPPGICARCRLMGSCLPHAKPILRTFDDLAARMCDTFRSVTTTHSFRRLRALPTRPRMTSCSSVVQTRIASPLWLTSCERGRLWLSSEGIGTDIGLPPDARWECNHRTKYAC